VSAELWKKVKHFVGIPEDGEYAEYDEPLAVSQPPQLEPLSEEPSLPRTGRRQRVERSTGSNLNNIIGLNSALSQSEMLIVEPKSFEDALEIVESLRSRKAVIVNLSSLEPEQAQRLIDFAAGATHAIDGHQERVGEGIFLFSPSNIVINPLREEQAWLNRDAKDLFWHVNAK
jgi:cell division inhibitor SepF